MSDPALVDAVRLLGPLPGSKTTAGSTSTSAVDLSAYRGQNVSLVATEAAHVRFGDSSVATATTDDWILPSLTPVVFAIEEGRDHFRAIRQGSTDSDIHHAPVSR